MTSDQRQRRLGSWRSVEEVARPFTIGPPASPCLGGFAVWHYARLRNVRLSKITGTSPTATNASDGNAASPRRSSRASW